MTMKEKDPLVNIGEADSPIWYPELDQETKTGFVICPEQKGNRIHLHTAIRKYTGATLAFLRGTNKPKSSVVKVEVSKLYDALGLLRSLQYDVDCFNRLPSTKYSQFRLTRQAAAFGVRLSVDEALEIPGLDSLVAYIEAEHADTIARARSSILAGVVDFDSLQEFFLPGKQVVDHGVATGISHVPTMMKVRACYFARGKSLFGVVSSFHVALEVVVAVGDDNYAIVEFQSLQSQFSGTRSITTAIDMFTIPTNNLEESLKARGEHYQVLCGQKNTDGTGLMVQYNTGSFLPVGSSASRGRASRSSGRMIVDTVSAWSRGVNCAVHNGVASDAVISSMKLYQQTRSQKQSQASEHLAYSTAAQTLADDGSQLNDLLVLPSPLPEELIGLTWPVVVGFSLAARTWGVAMVHGITPIEYNDSIFDSVVLPEKRKKLIKALVSNHSQNKSADLIAGKGEGSIFLLYGPPGGM